MNQERRLLWASASVLSQQRKKGFHGHPAAIVCGHMVTYFSRRRGSRSLMSATDNLISRTHRPSWDTTLCQLARVCVCVCVTVCCAFFATKSRNLKAHKLYFEWLLRPHRLAKNCYIGAHIHIVVHMSRSHLHGISTRVNPARICPMFFQFSTFP